MMFPAIVAGSVFFCGFFKILTNEEAHQPSQHCVSEEGMLGAEHCSGMG